MTRDRKALPAAGREIVGRGLDCRRRAVGRLRAVPFVEYDPGDHFIAGRIMNRGWRHLYRYDGLLVHPVSGIDAFADADWILGAGFQETQSDAALGLGLVCPQKARIVG